MPYKFLRGILGNWGPLKDTRRLSRVRPPGRGVTKIISKVLTNGLNMLITQNQSTFVEKRQIQDNILIANEEFQHLKIKKKGKRHVLALKVDMNKHMIGWNEISWKALW